MTVAKFSERTGLLPDTINKYKMGIRIPKPEAMEVIYRVTEGQVQPNDFYGL
jgi:DNA-binding transcriptional regulator YdaS (Cro superfamily)